MTPSRFGEIFCRLFVNLFLFFFFVSFLKTGDILNDCLHVVHDRVRAQDALRDAILWLVLQMLRCKVHMQQARIHERNKKTQLAVKAHEACARKFPHSKKVWIAFLTFLYQLLA